MNISRSDALRRTSAVVGGALTMNAFGMSAMPAQAAVESTAPLRVATPPNDSGAEVFYAIDNGFFKDAGLDVEMSPIVNGGAIAAAIAGGAIDIGNMSAPTFIGAYDKGIPLLGLAPSSVYASTSPTSSLVVPRASSLRRASDLKGRSVAVRELTNIAYYSVKAWLEKNALDPGAVRFIELADGDAIAALGSGRVDAAVLSEPFLYRSLDQNRVLANTYDAIAPAFLISLYVCNADFVKQRPVAARTFASSMIRSAQWANANRASSAKILEKYSKVTIDPSMQRVAYAERFKVSQVQPLIDLLAKEGVVKRELRAMNLFAILHES